MWKIVAYHTNDAIYSDHAENFKKSLDSLNIPYDITTIDESGDWYKGMQYKPTFLKAMLKKHTPYSIVYVDIDATFCQYPMFFDILDKQENIVIAAHILDHSKYRRKTIKPELLSGTLFLKNNDRAMSLVNDWILECSTDSRLWDQRALANVIKENDLTVLPEEYCVIFDYMAEVARPVIKHFQASRVARRLADKKVVRVKKPNIGQEVKKVGSGDIRTKLESHPMRPKPIKSRVIHTRIPKRLGGFAG
jgi:hypothetical protein